MTKTFFELASAGALGTGEVLERAFDDAVDEWNETETRKPLHEWLGISLFDYGRIVMGEKVEAVVASPTTAAG
jgi:hypothetical protein